MNRILSGIVLVVVTIKKQWQNCG